MSLTFSQLLSEHAVHSTAEAVTLVLAAVRACDAASSRRGQCFRLPDAAHIMLSSDGRVSFSTDLLEGTDVERVEHISLLLRQLLGVGCQRPAGGADIPGALLLLIARGLRQIDLPRPSYRGFQDALMRFGSFNRTVLSMVYDRVSPGEMTTLTLPDRIFRDRTVLPAVGAAAAVVISIALVWMHRPATGLPRPDFVTVQTSDVRVPIDTPAAAESSRNGSSRPQQGRSAIPPRPLLSSVVLGADVFSPSFAPRGELLFHSGRNHSALMRATFDGAGTPAVATLLRDGATNYHATVSPDGIWLSYDSDRDGTRGVYVARSDASEPRKISGDGYAAVPRWSPDGRHLAFLKAEDRRPRVWNVWVADLATGSTTRVSDHEVGQT